MKVQVRKIKYFVTRCSTCKTIFQSHSKTEVIKRAWHCHKRPVEIPAFKKGDLVIMREQRFCQTSRKYYKATATVIKLHGPQPSDYEYEVKWLGGKKERIHGHVYQYEVKFTCPKCGEKRTHLYYAPELAKKQTRRK